MTPALARSFLFVPADRRERFAKAEASGADMVILDLEDAVLPEGKATARTHLLTHLKPARGVVRINSYGTEWFAEDLAVLHCAGLQALILPKAELASIEALAPHLPKGMPLLALIETAKGILEAPQIAAHPAVQRLMFGSVDFANDVNAVEGAPVMEAARAALVLASAAAGLNGPVDGVSLDLSGGEGLEAEVRRRASEGFRGKLCIHPAQISSVHQGLAPSEAEVARARALLAAAQSADHGAIRFEGKLIDKPVLDRAKRLLATL